MLKYKTCTKATRWPGPITSAEGRELYGTARRVCGGDGPSGSGKSTMLNCISCYIPFEKGQVMLGDLDLTTMDEDALAKVRNTRLGFVFQDFMLLDGLSVRENIMMPRIIAGKADRDMGGLCRPFV